MHDPANGRSGIWDMIVRWLVSIILGNAFALLRAPAKPGLAIAIASSLALGARAETPDAPEPVTVPARAIGLPEVLRRADSQSFAARRAVARADVARDQANEAKWRLVPSISVAVGLWKIDGATQSSSTGEFDRATYATAQPYGRISYSANPVENYYGYVAADRRADAVDAGVRVAGREARVVATQQYFELVQATANLAIADKALADANEILRITEVLERQGTAKGDEVARARAGVAQAEQNQIRARRAIDQASIRLAAALDLEVTAPLAPDAADLVVGTTAPVSSAGHALAKRPELSDVRARIEAVRADRAAAWASLIAPAVEVYYLHGGLGPDYGNLDERRAYGALLTWTVSAAQIARVTKSGTRIRDATVERDELRARITAEVAAADADVRRASERLAPADRALAAAEDAFRIVGVRFRNGNAILVEVIAAQREVELARLARISAVVDLNTARARQRLVLGE